MLLRKDYKYRLICSCRYSLSTSISVTFYLKCTISRSVIAGLHWIYSYSELYLTQTKPGCLKAARLFNKLYIITGQAFKPPSMVKTEPVMYFPSSPARKDTSPAISSPVPYCGMAILLFRYTARSEFEGFISVSIGPG